MFRWLVTASTMLALVACAPLVSAQDADKPSKPLLGVMVENAGENEAGAVVRMVTPGSPAARAGLKSGDVIRKVNGEEVKDAAALTEWMGKQKAGDKITLHCQRDGKDQKFEVTLGKQEARRFGFGGGERIPAEARGAYLGVQTQGVSKELQDRLGLSTDKGAMVTDVLPETPAARAGLKVEDVIVGVNDRDIADPGELREVIQKAEVGKDVTLHVLRGKEKLTLKTQLAAAPFEFPGFREILPELKDGKIPFEFKEGNVPFELPKMMEQFRGFKNLNDMEKRIQELEKRLSDLEKQIAPKK